MFLNVGIELECVLNKSYRNLVKIGGWHQGEKFSKYWSTLSDSSLRRVDSDHPDISTTCEFNSVIIEGRANVHKAFVNMAEHLKVDMDEDLYSKVSFNKSCGAHIHFTFSSKPMWQDNKLLNTPTSRVHERLRMYEKMSALEKIDMLTNKPNTMLYIPTFYFRGAEQLFYDCARRNLEVIWKEKDGSLDKFMNGIMDHYGRSFAKRLDDCHYDNDNINAGSSSMRGEFHSSLGSGKGYEWRSINVLGTKTFMQVSAVIVGAYDALMLVYNEAKKYNFETKEEEHCLVIPNKESLELTTKRMKTMRVRFYSKTKLDIDTNSGTMDNQGEDDVQFKRVN